MSKVILTMQTSLDGVVSDVEQWMTVSDEIIEDSLEFYDTLDSIIIGGNTYPSLVEYWQNAEKSSGSELERRFAKRINEIEKLVISRSEVDLTWKNSKQLPAKDKDSLIREIENIKKSKREKISVESGVGAWQVFIKSKLFDEIWMFVHPIVVGYGEKLFEEIGESFSLQLNHSKAYKDGVVGLYYQKV